MAQRGGSRRRRDQQALKDRLLDAFEFIEAQFDAWDGGAPPTSPPPPPDAGSPYRAEAWPAWPPSRHVRVLGGSPGLQAALCLSTISAAAEIGRPIGLMAPESSFRWLLLAWLAQGGIPLVRLETGHLEALDWPKLSARMGRIVEADLRFAGSPADLAELSADSVVIAWMPDADAVAGLRGLAAGAGWGGYAAVADPDSTVDWWLTEEALRPMRLRPATLHLVSPRSV